MPNSYTKKAYITGKTAEVYTFDKPVYYGFQGFAPKNSAVRIPKPRSVFALSRSKKRIRRLVNSNHGMDKFLTLTFAENVTDIPQANYQFKIFRQKLERYLGRQFKYLGVLEFQKSGRIHYHVMLDIPYIEWQVLSKIWGYGRIQIETIRDKRKTGAYIAKYVTKGLDDIRLYGKRTYFYSIKLLSLPVEALDKIVDALLILVYKESKVLKEYTFYCDYRGRITYRLYSLC